MTTILDKGANGALPAEQLSILVGSKGAAVSLSAILLSSSGKVRTIDDYVYYGQPSSKDGSVRFNARTAAAGSFNHALDVDLTNVPADIERIQFALTIDPGHKATFSAVKDLEISISNKAGENLYSFNAAGSGETAFILGELYRRNGAWKVRHVAQGYAEGFAALAKQFGFRAEELEPRLSAGPGLAATPTPTQTQASVPLAQGNIQLTKSDQVTAALKASGSRLISLQKAASVSLKKHKAEGLVARVIMVLDASGSTRNLWPEMMQGVTDRLATLALNLDVKGELDFWVYASGYRKMAKVSLSNLDGYIARLQQGGDGSVTSTPPKKGLFGGGAGGDLIPGLGYDNNEPSVMKAILDQEKTAQVGAASTLPTLVLFVTDGGITRGPAIEKLLVEASHKPIFWQFVGFGGSGYGILEQFDEMTGRYVDNAGFFAIDDYRSIADEELYSRLVKEFPLWINRVKALGMI